MADGGAVTVLAIDDDPQSLELIAAIVEQKDVEVLTATDPERGIDLVIRHRPEIVLTDLMMPGLSGMDVLQRIMAIDSGIEVILLTAHYSTDSAVEAIQKGACDYITKPISTARLRGRIDSLIAEARRRRQARVLDQELLDVHRLEDIVGRSPLMREAFARIRRIAPHFRTVLVTGATGTGKELAARALHRLSPVSSGPFVVANCGAIPENLVESELFGYVRGAFTGADRDKAGLFEQAHGGTLLLDEIGELPLNAQPKLLRAIQQQEIQRIGSSASRRLDVRIIAATNRALRTMVGERTFRDDLFFRLGMVEIPLPPLAHRKDDMPLLIRHFIERYAAQYGKPITGISRRAEALLLRHPWPGNVRELEGVIGYAAMMAEGAQIDVLDFPEVYRKPGAAEFLDKDDDLRLSLSEMERRHARRVVESVAGNKLRAAEILGVSRATLYRLLDPRKVRGGEEGIAEEKP